MAFTPGILETYPEYNDTVDSTLFERQNTSISTISVTYILITQAPAWLPHLSWKRTRNASRRFCSGTRIR